MKVVLILTYCLITGINTAFGEIGEVRIRGNAVIIPLGNIVLVRKDSKYCAVKFKKAWTGETEQDQFAKYESYYQGDGSGDFSSENVQFKKEQLVDRRMVGISRFFSFPAGPRNKNIKCGPIRLSWSGGGSVYFYAWGQEYGDYGIELAPTKWTDISQVNVSDPRLKWYKYDGYRKEKRIPIDELW